jgi:hypothetical protein
MTGMDSQLDVDQDSADVIDTTIEQSVNGGCAVHQEHPYLLHKHIAYTAPIRYKK